MYSMVTVWPFRGMAPVPSWRRIFSTPMMVVLFFGGVGVAVDEEESLLVEVRKLRAATKGGGALALIQRPRGRKAKARKGRDRTDMASAG